MPQGSHRNLERSAVESCAASAAAAMCAAADSLQARLELVLDERLGALSADQRGFLQVAMRDGQRLLKLLADFREIALADAGLLELEWGRVDLDETASQAADAVAARADALAKSVVVRAEDPTPIAADSARVHDAIVRLARHAVQHSAPGSPIEILVRGGAIAIVYEADGPLPADSIAVAFASAIARAHGGRLAVAWDDPRVEIGVALESAETSVVRLGVAA